jgi:hypothetical protein
VFVSDDKWVYVRGDMVVLGVNHPKEAVAERVKEEGRFLLYYAHDKYYKFL